MSTQFIITSPFNTLINEWIEQGQLEGLSDKSIARYQYCLFKFTYWLNEYYPNLKDFTIFNVSHAKGYLNYLREARAERWGIATKPGKEKLKFGTVHMYVSPVANFFYWLEANDYIAVSPFSHKSLKLKTNRSRKQEAAETVSYIPEDDLKKLLAYISTKEYTRKYVGCRNAAIIKLLLDSLMRRGELLSMRVQDLNIDKMRCEIRGKGPQRTIFFSTISKAALIQYWNSYRSFQDISPTKEFWLTEDGEPLSYSSIGALFTDLSKRLNIKLHTHMTRHTGASLLQNKVSLFELQFLLGHKDLKSTRIYTHVTTEDVAKVYRDNSPLSGVVIEQKKRRRGRPRIN